MTMLTRPESAVTSKPRRHRHVWGELGSGAPWPAVCRYCDLRTFDPDAFFMPAADPDVVAERYLCPGSPTRLHEPGEPSCTVCGIVRDPAASRRGRHSLRAGKDAERAIARAYGGTRTGQFGGPDDVLVGDLFTVQSKAGGWFSERIWAELAKLPRTGGRIPTLIVSDRPSVGVHARRYVVRMMADDVDLHGGKQ